MLKNNLLSVKEKIKQAAIKAGRNPADIELIAVSKTKPVEMIQEIYNLGIREFGENKVQEITAKSEILPKDIHWHMIGHLQRNKVKTILSKTVLIHSVDSVRLAKTISDEAVKQDIIANILLEVNVANEDTKFGFTPDETEKVLIEIASMPNIFVRGLMTSAPFVDNPEENRQYFRQLKQLCVDLKAKNIDNTSMDFLSMGMTNDYEVAIEEGATHVRVGTAIFGERNYII